MNKYTLKSSGLKSTANREFGAGSFLRPALPVPHSRLAPQQPVLRPTPPLCTGVLLHTPGLLPLLMWGRLTPFQPWTDSPNCRPLWVGQGEAGNRSSYCSPPSWAPPHLGSGWSSNRDPDCPCQHAPSPNGGPGQQRGEKTPSFPFQSPKLSRGWREGVCLWRVGPPR